VWTDAYSVGGAFFWYDGWKESFVLAHSYDELLKLFSENTHISDHYVSENIDVCEHRICKRLSHYDEEFFKDRALIINTEYHATSGGAFVIDAVKVSDQTLYLELVYLDGLLQGGGQTTLFIEVKKSKIEGVTNKAKTVTGGYYYGKLDWHHKVILEENDAKGERNYKKAHNEAYKNYIAAHK
ncbi:MAG: hypothetical protein IKC35_04925, partial [Clostridia bacterium]|nr:hypothetical protein [Clostridia bacterium]